MEFDGEKPTTTTMRITLEFSGGLDVIFDGKKESFAELPTKCGGGSDDNGEWTIRRLLQWMMANLLHGNDRSDMLIQRGTVRPGVLVLLNQTDWEILGGLDAALAHGDTVTFISTLHGG